MPDRGWTKPAYPSGIATARPVPTTARSPGASSWRPEALRSRPASPGYARSGRTASSRSRRTCNSVMRGARSCARARGGRPRLCDQVASEAPHFLARQARADEDAFFFVRTLVHRRSQLVQLGEPRAVRVRDQQPHGLEPLGEALGDARTQLVQPLPASRRDQQCVRKAVREPPTPQRVDGVDLVQDQLDGQLRGADLAEHALDGPQHLVEPLLGGRGVGDVNDEIGDQRLLERGREALDELMRQSADEADGVGEQVAAPVDVERARRRVQGLEEAVVHRRAGSGERVQQRRLPYVGVAGERDRRRLRPPARLAACRTLLGECLESPPQKRDSAPRQASVRLELRLPGAARSDPAAESLEVLPEAAHAREVVLQLRELDLELALGGHRVLGEDVEDQLRPVDDTRLERVFEGALLHRAELVVDDQHLRLRSGIRLLQLGELAFTDVGARVGACSVLNERGDRLDARRPRELLELGELFFRDDALSENGEGEPALRLSARRRVGLMCRHLSIMPARREDSMRPTASSSCLSGTVSEMRKYPSPLGPYAGPGETTTPACSRTSSANDSDVYPSGTRTQKYGVAFGRSTGRPIASRPSAIMSRLRS